MTFRRLLPSPSTSLDIVRVWTPVRAGWCDHYYFWCGKTVSGLLGEPKFSDFEWDVESGLCTGDATSFVDGRAVRDVLSLRTEDYGGHPP